MTEPSDQMPAGRGHLRASHADREHVIGVLKAAFVQGRLTKAELDARVSQAFVARTYADLAALTADIPAEPAAVGAAPPTPARRAPLVKAAAGSGGCLVIAYAAMQARSVPRMSDCRQVATLSARGLVKGAPPSCGWPGQVPEAI